MAQCEHIALTIAAAIADEQRTFNPVKFMRAACDVAAIGQLAPAIRRDFEARSGRDSATGVEHPRSAWRLGCGYHPARR